MLTHEEIKNWEESLEYYNPSYGEKAKLHCMTPMSMVREFADKTGQDPKPYLYAALIQEETDEWRSAYIRSANCPECYGSGDWYTDNGMTWEPCPKCNGKGHLDGKRQNTHNELKELADLVYVIYGYANSKGWNLDEALRRVHHNNVGRCIQPDGTIKRRADGKIEKNKDYPKVNLEDLL